MSHGNPLILHVDLAGAEPYVLGDEIRQQPLPDAIRAEAETIADYAGPDLLHLSQMPIHHRTVRAPLWAAALPTAGASQ